MVNNKKTVSLIVLNYNGLKHLKEYFSSVYEQTLIPDEIIMMDNLCVDGSRDFVKKYFPKVKIVTEDRYNTGTANGSNVGFKHSRGDYVIFQSNDIRLDKNCVKGLYEAMERDKKVGICTSVLLNYYEEKKGKLILDNAGGMADVYGFSMQRYPLYDFKKIPSAGEVFYSYGGSFIIRRDIYKKIGGFDDRFFTLNDDIDLSWRVRLLGYKIVYTKKSFVFHKVSATLGTLYDRGIKRYWSERNAMRTLLKNATFLHLLKYFPGYLALLSGEMGYFIFRGRFDLFAADAKAIGWNLLYLPETIILRHKIQSIKKRGDIEKIMQKNSFKLQLFKDFKNSL